MDEDYCQNFYVEYKVSLLWKIKNFTGKCLKHQTGDYMSSPKYYVAGHELSWNLELAYPSKSERIIISLMSSKKRNTFFTCELALIGLSGEKLYPKTFCKCFDGLPYKIYLTSWCKLLDNKPQLLPNDELTISCVLSAATKTDTVGKVTRSVHELMSDQPKEHSLVNDFARFFAIDADSKRDVLFKVGNYEIAAHKNVLRCRSPVFAAMFEHEMLETNIRQVTVKDVNYDVMGELVRFLYTDDVDCRDVDFSVKLLLAADKYQIPLLISRCAEYLEEFLSVTNVFDVLRVANSCNQHELCESCMNLIKEQMSSVSLLKEWISMLKSNPEVLGVIDEHLNKE